MRVPSKLKPLSTSKNQFLTPKNKTLIPDVFTINTLVRFEKKQDIYSTFLNDDNGSYRMMPEYQTPTHHLRHISL